ncbi:hypothetical protein CKO42_17290 [Lamprobacter modestohalophilus]|uniref:Uncharacterized protein n=1 Tax=Lamprobacter modestohalophilus TaxID=1064514 RepID=A0A9X0WB32_9GAMM|nr:hypothetical protein [Lamprobacter modestohalophilus]MBK1620164.1 hypothetical protein [Lamprobacter modestohalophilus]
MTRPTSSLLVPVAVLAVGLSLFPETGEARSVLGRLWDRFAEPSVEILAKAVPPKTAAAMRWPQSRSAANGRVIAFVSSHQKGTLGDRLTALRLTGQGYEKLPSKYNSLHGIDGVFVRRTPKGDIAEIRLVENKVDSAMLNPGPPAQMSDAWIRQSCQKMLNTGDAGAADTARLVLAHLDSPRLRRELWHHDLSTGKTTVRSVDHSGQPQNINQRWGDRLVANELNRQCEAARLVCQTP